jgi:hypothetical protein
MASQVEIANRALTKIGEARITALSDNLEAARVISAMWDIVRDSELRARNWNFSITRASLAALVTTPAFRYTYEFQLPSLCLKVIQVGEYYPGPSMSDYRNAPEAEYQIEGRKILTDYPAPLYIRYVESITDTGQWDAMFVEAFACKLAIEICERLTQSNTKRQLAAEEYKEAISMAVRSDAVENPPEAIPDSAWLLSRL